MTYAIHELQEIRAEVYTSLGTPVDLGRENDRELRESYIALTDEIDRELGRSALFALEPEMLYVAPAPDAPMCIQGELFQISPTKQEEITNV